MYLPEMRPWLVGKRPNPPPEECGLVPLLYDPAMRWESGRTEPVKAPPEERELWWLDANALLCCSGREKPWPSWMVTTKMPGFFTTGACDRASAPPMGDKESEQVYQSINCRLRLTGNSLAGRRGGAWAGPLFIFVGDGGSRRRPGKRAQRAEVRVLELCANLVSFMRESLPAGGQRRRASSPARRRTASSSELDGTSGEQAKRRDILLVSFHDMVTVPARPLDGMEQIK